MTKDDLGDLWTLKLAAATPDTTYGMSSVYDLAVATVTYKVQSNHEVKFWL